MVDQLNTLLNDDRWWGIDQRVEAEREFEPIVVSTFYDEIEVGEMDSMSLREKHISLPSQADGYGRIFLVGTTGAGKTTLLRHIIGSDHKRDRFPSISTARTTTADIEIVIAGGSFKAVITFMGRVEARSLVDECVEEACVTVVRDQGDTRIAESLLSHREQRFRLSYLLGSWTQNETIEAMDFSFEDLEED